MEPVSLTNPEVQQTNEVDTYNAKTLLAQLTPENQKKALEIANQINITDSTQIMQYGIGAQNKISNFSESILSKVKAKDAGHSGEMMAQLMLKVKDIDVDSLNQEKGFLQKIFGGPAKSAKQFLASYDKVSNQIDGIVDELDNARMTMLKDIHTLDTLYQKNLEYLDELNVYIAAGNIKLEELNNVTIPEAKVKAEQSGDPIDAQKTNDLMQLANRFEKKLHDLELSRIIAIQTAPQIRLIQNNDHILADKIQTSILNTIPLWKNQIVIAIGLFRQSKALEMQKSVNQTTNDLLLKNSEMLKTNTLEVARESEKGIVEIETLKKVNSDLISTIEETIQIQKEGAQKRREAEIELHKIEEELKQKLISVKQ